MEKVSKMLGMHRDNIDRLVARLQEGEGPMPQIEIDLLLEELRRFYADLLMRPDAAEEQPVVEVEPAEAAAPVTAKPPTQEPDLAPLMAEPVV